MNHRIQYALLVLGAASFAGCDYFTNVVIPAVDTTPPSSIAAVYDVVRGGVLGHQVRYGQFQSNRSARRLSRRRRHARWRRREAGEDRWHRPRPLPKRG